MRKQKDRKIRSHHNLLKTRAMKIKKPHRSTKISKQKAVKLNQSMKEEMVRTKLNQSQLTINQDLIQQAQMESQFHHNQSIMDRQVVSNINLSHPFSRRTVFLQCQLAKTKLIKHYPRKFKLKSEQIFQHCLLLQTLKSGNVIMTT